MIRQLTQKNMNANLVSATANEIRKYLAQHPGRFDTIEGVHIYWLNWGCNPELMHVTQAALTQLEQNGVVETVAIEKQIVWRSHRTA